jgi:hypothetical protein
MSERRDVNRDSGMNVCREREAETGIKRERKGEGMQQCIKDEE